MLRPIAIDPTQHSGVNVCPSVGGFAQRSGLRPAAGKLKTSSKLPLVSGPDARFGGVEGAQLPLSHQIWFLPDCGAKNAGYVVLVPLIKGGPHF